MLSDLTLTERAALHEAEGGGKKRGPYIAGWSRRTENRGLFAGMRPYEGVERTSFVAGWMDADKVLQDRADAAEAEARLRADKIRAEALEMQGEGI